MAEHRLLGFPQCTLMLYTVFKLPNGPSWIVGRFLANTSKYISPCRFHFKLKCSTFLSFNAEFHPSPCCSTHDDLRLPPCHTAIIKYNLSPPTFPPLFVLCSNTDVHTVASLLKLYLRELPEPVIPFHKYDEFLTCAKLLGKDDETVRKRTWLPINCLSYSPFL